MSKYRTEYCGKLRKKDLGKEVKLAGWIHRKRDHGNLIFVDLRGHTGICQLVFNPENEIKSYKTVNKLKLESVISVSGKVVERSPEAVNTKIETGDIEVFIKDIEDTEQQRLATPTTHTKKISYITGYL